VKKNDQERWWAIEQKMERYHDKLEKQYRSTVDVREDGPTLNLLAEIGSGLWSLGTALMPVGIVVFIIWLPWHLAEGRGLVATPNIIPWFLAPLILAFSAVILGIGHILQRWGQKMFQPKPRGSQSRKK
jgi:hypothetical protein